MNRTMKAIKALEDRKNDVMKMKREKGDPSGSLYEELQKIDQQIADIMGVPIDKLGRLRGQAH